MELVKVENNEIQVSEEYLQDFAKYLQAKARFELKEKAFKEELLKAMEENGILNYSNDLFSVSYKKATKRKSLDSKLLKEELPDIYEQYVKESDVKSCLVITMK